MSSVSTSTTSPPPSYTPSLKVKKDTFRLTFTDSANIERKIKISLEKKDCYGWIWGAIVNFFTGRLLHIEDKDSKSNFYIEQSDFLKKFAIATLEQNNSLEIKKDYSDFADKEVDKALLNNNIQEELIINNTSLCPSNIIKLFQQITQNVQVKIEDDKTSKHVEQYAKLHNISKENLKELLSQQALDSKIDNFHKPYIIDGTNTTIYSYIEKEFTKFIEGNLYYDDFFLEQYFNNPNLDIKNMLSIIISILREKDCESIEKTLNTMKDKFEDKFAKFNISIPELVLVAKLHPDKLNDLLLFSTNNSSVKLPPLSKYLPIASFDSLFNFGSAKKLITNNTAEIKNFINMLKMNDENNVYLFNGLEFISDLNFTKYPDLKGVITEIFKELNFEDIKSLAKVFAKSLPEEKFFSILVNRLTPDQKKEILFLIFDQTPELIKSTMRREYELKKINEQITFVKLPSKKYPDGSKRLSNKWKRSLNFFTKLSPFPDLTKSECSKLFAKYVNPLHINNIKIASNFSSFSKSVNLLAELVLLNLDKFNEYKDINKLLIPSLIMNAYLLRANDTSHFYLSNQLTNQKKIVLANFEKYNPDPEEKEVAFEYLITSFGDEVGVVNKVFKSLTIDEDKKIFATSYLKYLLKNENPQKIVTLDQLKDIIQNAELDYIIKYDWLQLNKSLDIKILILDKILSDKDENDIQKTTTTISNQATLYPNINFKDALDVILSDGYEPSFLTPDQLKIIK